MSSTLPEQLAILSFQVQQEIYEAEMRNDDSDFLDKIDPGTLVCEFLPDYQRHLPLLKTFGIDHCLQKGYRQLSSGQCRKLLFLQKLISGATTLLSRTPMMDLMNRVVMNLIWPCSNCRIEISS